MTTEQWRFRFDTGDVFAVSTKREPNGDWWASIPQLVVGACRRTEHGAVYSIASAMEDRVVEVIPPGVPTARERVEAMREAAADLCGDYASGDEIDGYDGIGTAHEMSAKIRALPVTP